MRRVFQALQQIWLRRPLVEEETVILKAVRQKYPAQRMDVIFFISEEKPLLPVRSSALLQVWGANGNGPWVHLTNIAGFMRDGMSLDEIKRTQF